ncbi:MAG: hypothetical protein ACI4NV_06180, partial [Thermoguttaceae bacterium]
VKDPLRNAKDAWIWLLGGVEPRCLEWTPDNYRAMGGSSAQINDPPKIDRQTVYRFPIGNEEDPSRYDVHPNAAVAVLADAETGLWGVEGVDWFDAYEKCASPFEQKIAYLVNNTLVSSSKPAAPNYGRIFAFNLAIPATPLDIFSHIALKLTLNNISTATMGKYGRLNGNWMAHVDATNKKLVDRSVRLVSEIANVDYRTACVTLFEALEEMETWSMEKKKTISPAAYAVEILAKRSKEN